MKVERSNQPLKARKAFSADPKYKLPKSYHRRWNDLRGSGQYGFILFLF